MVIFSPAVLGTLTFFPPCDSPSSGRNWPRVLGAPYGIAPGPSQRWGALTFDLRAKPLGDRFGCRGSDPCLTRRPGTARGRVNVGNRFGAREAQTEDQWVPYVEIKIVFPMSWENRWRSIYVTPSSPPLLAPPREQGRRPKHSGNVQAFHLSPLPVRLLLPSITFQPSKPLRAVGTGYEKWSDHFPLLFRRFPTGALLEMRRWIPTLQPMR